MTDNANDIDPKDFLLIRDLIETRTGIRVRDSRKDYLGYRVRERMNVTGIADFEEYYFFLKYSAVDSGEFQALMNLVTVQETCFYRNMDQLRSFQDIILKGIIDRKKAEGSNHIKLWSAASSTGEEALTLAMIINDTLDFPTAWRIEILATDISTRALDIARKAVYPKERFDNLPKDKLAKYFEVVDGGYKAKRILSDMISFEHFNLTKDIDANKFSRLKNMDVIFCRNVFIYFPQETQQALASRFLELLVPEGHLLLGNAESVDIRKVPFIMTFLPGGMIYQKV